MARIPLFFQGYVWRERVGVEPTQDGASRPATVLKFAWAAASPLSLVPIRCVHSRYAEVSMLVQTASYRVLTASWVANGWQLRSHLTICLTPQRRSGHLEVRHPP